MKTLRAHGFNQRPRFEQVVGYLERNEPYWISRTATSQATSPGRFCAVHEDPNHT